MNRTTKLSICLFCQARHTPPPGVSQKIIKRQWRFYTLPSGSPKPTLDTKHIAQNPGLYEQNCRDRNYKTHFEYPNQIRHSRQTLNEIRHETTSLRKELAALERRIGHAARAQQGVTDADENETIASLLEEARVPRQQLEETISREKQLENQIMLYALAMPNLTSHYTPIGHSPHVISVKESLVADLSQKNKSHVDIGTELGILDFRSASSTSGWGFYFLEGLGALLEQALLQYALSLATTYGWTITTPPSLVYSYIAAACGFQPRDQNNETQIYHVAQESKDFNRPQLCLSGTAEIPLAGMYANTTMEADHLPIKRVGVSKCYRAEAGARGVEAKGLYRVHEFNKVEMFAWTAPDSMDNSIDDGAFDVSEHSAGPSQSTEVFDQMLSIQDEILTALGLRHRALEMPSTDLGASAHRKIDMEVWFPSRSGRTGKKIASLDSPHEDSGWGEVTSTSICTDYQTRRLATKLRRRNWSTTFPYTINGTALAVPRVLAAVMETHWDEDQRRMWVPEVLRRWMPDGCHWIEK